MGHLRACSRVDRFSAGGVTTSFESVLKALNDDWNQTGSGSAIT